MDSATGPLRRAISSVAAHAIGLASGSRISTAPRRVRSRYFATSGTMKFGMRCELWDDEKSRVVVVGAPRIASTPMFRLRGARDAFPAVPMRMHRDGPWRYVGLTRLVTKVGPKNMASLVSMASVILGLSRARRKLAIKSSRGRAIVSHCLFT
jgi:hypothetical protein